MLRSESISAAHWLSIGIELEDLKSVHCFLSLATRVMDFYRFKVKTKFNGLKADRLTVLRTVAAEQNVDTIRRIRAWKDRQIIHMPGLVESSLWEPMPDKDEDGQVTDCWTIVLQFLSSLDAKNREKYSSKALIEKEIKLRTAVAHDSLAQIRSLLQKEWWLVGRKMKHVLGSGQKRNIKANAALQLLAAQRTGSVERYRRNREALSRLNPTGSWASSLKVLKESDIRMLDDDEGKGEGRWAPSWIWGIRKSTSIDEKEVYGGSYLQSHLHLILMIYCRYES